MRYGYHDEVEDEEDVSEDENEVQDLDEDEVQEENGMLNNIANKYI